VPVAAHPFEDAIRPGLQRRVEMGCEVRGGFDQQTRDRVVDFGGLDRRQTEADLGDGGDQGCEEVPEGRLTPGASPGITHTRCARVRLNPAARSTRAGSAPPTTARTDGRPAMRPLSSAAAQPITTVSRRPFCRASRRTRRPSFASLSWVTVQEFTTARSAAAGSSTTTTP